MYKNIDSNFPQTIYGYMKRNAIRKNKIIETEKKINLGAGFFVIFQPTSESIIVHLFRSGILIKNIKLEDKFAKKCFLVEAVEIGCQKKAVAEAFGMSRQTIDTYIRIKNKYGYAGLLHSRSKLSKTIQQESGKDIPNNKRKVLATERKAKREAAERIQKGLNFSFDGKEKPEEIDSEDQMFSENHEWEPTRYAGVFVYLIALTSFWKWGKLIIGYFGNAYKIFMVFVLMAARDIRSIEQLKNVRQREAGIILGISKLPSIPYIWKWFYNAVRKNSSILLLRDFFLYQIRAGLVSVWSLFIDGHLLPYTGKEKVHRAYYTQRRMPYPGQTNMVSADGSGRIVFFDIQEGLGDIRGHIIDMSKKVRLETKESPIIIFDREGYGAKFFYNLIEAQSYFVCWEKNVDTEKLAMIKDEKYGKEFKLNGKDYSVFEDVKEFSFENEEKETEHFSLRLLHIWNVTSGHRTCGLAWTGDQEVSTVDCANLILNRWGASENTFKHLKERHPLHYNPGFGLVESQKQEIKNPDFKKINYAIRDAKKQLSKLYKKLSNSEPQLNKDGTPRLNSLYKKTNLEIEKREQKLSEYKKKKTVIPETINLDSLENYESYKKIDNEGKNLFDFVTCSIWNARKMMVEWLSPYFRDNEIVDLFYAITNCQGWIKSTEKSVVVRLEPLQQSKRLYAQKQLCKKLTNLCSQSQTGKYLSIEVGSKPEYLKKHLK